MCTRDFTTDSVCSPLILLLLMCWCSLGSFIARRQQIAAFYDTQFESLGAVTPQKV